MLRINLTATLPIRNKLYQSPTEVFLQDIIGLMKDILEVNMVLK